jgi:hypothetical protein
MARNDRTPAERDRARRKIERRTSGGHGIHLDRRTKRARTRGAALARHFRES